MPVATHIAAGRGTATKADHCRTAVQASRAPRASRSPEQNCALTRQLFQAVDVKHGAVLLIPQPKIQLLVEVAVVQPAAARQTRWRHPPNASPSSLPHPSTKS